MVYAGPLERSVRGSTKAKTQTAEEAGKVRAQLQEKKAKLNVERPVRTEFRQKDLLMEALDTEVSKLAPSALCGTPLHILCSDDYLILFLSFFCAVLPQEANAKWLVAQSMQETERAQADKPVKTHSESHIRFSSRRGTYNTITFSQVEVMPPILSGNLAPPSTGPQVSARGDQFELRRGFESQLHCFLLFTAQKCVITGLPAKYRDPATMLPYATIEAFREIRRRYGRNADGHGSSNGGAFNSRIGSREDLSHAKW